MELTVEWAKIAQTTRGVQIWGKQSCNRYFTVKIYHGEIAEENEGCFKYGDRMIETQFGVLEEISTENACNFLESYHLFMNKLMFVVVYGAITAPL